MLASKNQWAFGHCCCCGLDRAADQAELQLRAGRADQGTLGLVAVPIVSCGSFSPTLPPHSDSLCLGKGPRWDGERLGDDADEKHDPVQAKLSLLEVRVSLPTKPRVALSITSPWMCLPLAWGSPFQQQFSGQQQQLHIMSAKPKRLQEPELLLGHQGKGTTCRCNQHPATTGLLVLKAATFSYGSRAFSCLSGRDACRHGSSLAVLVVLPSSRVTLTVPVRPSRPSGGLGCSPARDCPRCQAAPG